MTLQQLHVALSVMWGLQDRLALFSIQVNVNARRQKK